MASLVQLSCWLYCLTPRENLHFTLWFVITFTLQLWSPRVEFGPGQSFARCYGVSSGFLLHTKNTCWKVNCLPSTPAIHVLLSIQQAALEPNSWEDWREDLGTCFNNLPRTFYRNGFQPMAPNRWHPESRIKESYLAVWTDLCTQDYVSTWLPKGRFH